MMKEKKAITVYHNMITPQFLGLEQSSLTGKLVMSVIHILRSVSICVNLSHSNLFKHQLSQSGAILGLDHQPLNWKAADTSTGIYLR